MSLPPTIASYNPNSPAIGVLLAGGQSRRMGGGDKCLLQIAGRSMLDWSLERARPQVRDLLLNANGDPSRFTIPPDMCVWADSVPGYAGPLAGLLAGMDWARQQHPQAQWLASFAADTPFFPTDLVERLAAALQHSGAQMACASSGGSAHPVFGLWPIQMAEDLRAALVTEGIRRVQDWIERQSMVTVDWSDRPFAPFTNINTKEELLNINNMINDNIISIY